MNNLKELRTKSGLTGQNIASDLGIERASYVRYENGTREPSIDLLKKFAEYFSVTVGCIVGAEPIPEGYPDQTYFPVSHEQVIKDQQKAEAEGRIMHPEFLPAYRIGNNPSEQPAKRKKSPFTREQEEYLEEMEDRIVSKMTVALREDTSSSSEEDAQ